MTTNKSEQKPKVCNRANEPVIGISDLPELKKQPSIFPKKKAKPKETKQAEDSITISRKIKIDINKNISENIDSKEKHWIVIDELIKSKKQTLEAKEKELTLLTICPQNRVKRAEIKLIIDCLINEIRQISSGISKATYYSSLNRVLEIGKDEIEKQIKDIGLSHPDYEDVIDIKTGKLRPKKRRNNFAKEETPTITKKAKIVAEAAKFINALILDGEIEGFKGTVK